MTSFVEMPASVILDQAKQASRNIESHRLTLMNDAVEREARRRMTRWFSRLTFDQAKSQVKADHEFMYSMEMRLCEIHASESYEIILDLAYAAKNVMSVYKTDAPPIHVSVKDLARLDTWRGKP